MRGEKSGPTPKWLRLPFRIETALGGRGLGFWTNQSRESKSEFTVRLAIRPARVTGEEYRGLLIQWGE